MGKILIVDDTRTMVALLKAHLAGLGHEYVTATDGREALLVVEREKPDLVISDVMMPNMSGLDFIRELKSRPAHAQTPVVLISSQWNTERRMEALQAGAVACLGKPLQVNWLTKIVAQLVRPGGVLAEDWSAPSRRGGA